MADDPSAESVWDYPRPPALQPCTRRVRIELGGVTIVDSTAALRVLETSHPPTIYVPPQDIAPGCIRPGAGRSFCEWKGIACYLDDERVQSQAGDFYGGWITARLRGPFKGGPGTTGW